MEGIRFDEVLMVFYIEKHVHRLDLYNRNISSFIRLYHHLFILNDYHVEGIISALISCRINANSVRIMKVNNYESPRIRVWNVFVNFAVSLICLVALFAHPSLAQMTGADWYQSPNPAKSVSITTSGACENLLVAAANKDQQVLVPDSGVTITPKVDECKDDPYEISEIGNPDVVIIKHLEPRQS